VCKGRLKYLHFIIFVILSVYSYQGKQIMACYFDVQIYTLLKDRLDIL